MTDSANIPQDNGNINKITSSPIKKAGGIIRKTLSLDGVKGTIGNYSRILKADTGQREFVGNIDEGIEKNFKDPSNIRMQEFAMNADSNQIKTLKNNMNIKGAKQEKEFNENMLEAVKAYIGNDSLNKRDLKDLVERQGIKEGGAENMVNERYKERLKTLGIKDENLDKMLEKSRKLKKNDDKK